MTADLELRNYSKATKKEYLLRARNFVAHYNRSPTELGAEEIRAFMLHLINESFATHLLEANLYRLRRYLHNLLRSS